jgi:hypothetical protein
LACLPVAATKMRPSRGFTDGVFDELKVRPTIRSNSGWIKRPSISPTRNRSDSGGRVGGGDAPGRRNGWAAGLPVSRSTITTSPNTVMPPTEPSAVKKAVTKERISVRIFSLIMRVHRSAVSTSRFDKMRPKEHFGRGAKRRSPDYASCATPAKGVIINQAHPISSAKRPSPRGLPHKPAKSPQSPTQHGREPQG